MTVKLLLLKSGEDIISDVTEMIVGEGESSRVIGYYLNKPCVVKVLKPISQIEKEDHPKQGVQVSLFPWMPLTTEENIPVPPDWVVTMVEPVANLKEMYTNDVINYGKNNENFGTDEQSDSDNSN